MILKHDIPDGSRLYFEDNAKLKREIENNASNILEKLNFSEIVLPSFSYYQYQCSDNKNDIIKISNEENTDLSLKKDSTLDVLRLVSHRVHKNTNSKKWYYTQAEFKYPSNEYYKIGAEYIDSDDLPYIINTMIQICKNYYNAPTLQISNINIIHIICDKYNIDIEKIKDKNYAYLFNLEHEEVQLLLAISSVEDLEDLSKYSKEVREELLKIKEVISKVSYDDSVIEIFFYPEMTYYSSVFFRFFDKNTLLSNGGIYEDNHIISSGFAIYVDNLIDNKKKENK